jgi:hypothetical protein
MGASISCASFWMRADALNTVMTEAFRFEVRSVRKRLLDSAGILKSGFEQCQWEFQKRISFPFPVA